MYHVIMTINLGQAASYADAMRIVDMHRGNGLLKIHPVQEDGTLAPAVTVCSPGGKLSEALQGPKPAYNGRKSDDV